ncbi:heavy metal translocating P-type ATPase [Motiliproteus sediminis]|uniref:heavy metal translocating P-type ATPase n=1 Tax=Motiliproteus sediminis TaxID=1468178 RepID=UPI001FE549FB|nr:heavy metal translocating P-type ATPase [Motiliproteus sediminis]
MMAYHHFQLQGVRCDGCVNKIRQALRVADPVAELDIDLTRQLATLTTSLDSQVAAGLIAPLGYQPVLLPRQTLHFFTDGVRCNGCLGKIRQAVEALDADATLTADFPAQRVSVETALPAELVCELIGELGYGAKPELPAEYHLAVQGVGCMGCVGNIERALQQVDANAQVDAAIAEQRLSITTRLARADVEAIVAELGYLAPADEADSNDAATACDSAAATTAANRSGENAAGCGEAINLSLSGMTCAACVASVEKALKGVSGVASAQVNFANRTARIEGDAAADTLISAVQRAGYGAELIEDQATADEQRRQREAVELKQRLRNVALALLLGVPMMLYGIIEGMALDTQSARVGWGVVGLLTLAMMWVAGRHFFVGAWKSLRGGSANMDTLIALGTGSAWLYSMVAVAAPALIPAAARGLYFEAAAMIIGLVNLGQALELRARGRTQAAVRSLLDLRPKTARVIREGHEADLPLEQVRVGDLVRIRPGEHVPVDAEVVEGRSQVDESMLTGEPLAVVKAEGDMLSAGTTNGRGSLVARAARVGRDTALARIVDLVQKAQNSKPPISRLADRVAAIFVPVVVVIAGLTALVWFLVGPEPRVTYMLVTAVTVLIIACPCALGLATPISIMIGVGKAAELGVLIRSGDALQQASRLTTVVVDKTGTVTEGQPRVTAVQRLGEGGEQWLQALYLMERRSEHPLAEAIADYAAQQYDRPGEPDVLSFEAIAGQGVRATVEGVTYCAGNRALMASQGVDTTVATEQAEQWHAAAQTVVYVAADGQLLALLAITDPVREDAAAAIARLQQDGIRVVMLSGDNSATVKAVAQSLGIDEARAELQPEEKLQVIAELQQQGQRVAMVGDGINDAPALSRADVGFAIGTGTDVAIESADVALMKASLHGVADAIELSRATLTNIRQNLWGAFIYNGLGIPVAAGLLYPLTGMLLNPVVAGLAMSLSSVTVVSNANRLRWFSPSNRK